jgi:hypothetical protein
MDSLPFQRSLTLLEDRYRELREIGQKRFDAWETEVNALKGQLSEQAKQLREEQQGREREVERVKALEAGSAELAKGAEVLKQQLAAQSAQMQELQQTRDQQSERVKALEAEKVEAAKAADELKGQLAEEAAAKAEALEEAELMLLQLHQVQEELEQTFLNRQSAERARDEFSARLRLLEDESTSAAKRAEDLKAELELRVTQLQTSRDEEAVANAEAREECELTLLQLHQVQEELEHYFLHAQSSQQLAHAQQEQLGRVQALMARLLPEAAALARDPRVDVEVLPPLPPAAPVQTEALLSSYASSLHRAGLLLQRALQR